ncbi:DUF2341 domain-containing protein [bacterium]|jgi:Tfp pilus assembly protein FimT|nr:DUF2341 domain-containing protein [bacterium]MBT4649427.1 DUF2341 domain-containing protein [bacterium]
MLAKLKKQDGVSLIEIIIVVAIFVMILSSVVGLVSNRTVKEDLRAKALSIVDLLNRARNYAVTGYYGDNWGIKILDDSTDCYSDGASGDCMILYKGTSYINRSTGYDETLLLDTGAYFDADQETEFYFAKTSGWLSTTTGSLTGQMIRLKNNYGNDTMINVNALGLIYQGTNGYNYRRSIAVDNTKVSGSTSLANFPFLLGESNDYFKTITHGGNIENDNGYDILFASDINGNHVLPYEIEKYSSTTGELIAWVKIPELKTGENTVIHVFYGNPDIASSQERITEVWDSNYQMVQHMNEDPSGDAPQIIDSTDNDHDGTAVGTFSSGDLVDGQIGYTINFNGSAAKFDFVSNNPIGTAENGFTLSAWVSHDAVDSSQHVVSFNNIQLRPTLCYVREDMDPDPDEWRSINYSTEDPADDTWYYLVCNFDSDNLRVYIAGSETTNSPETLTTGDILDASNFVVGYLQGSEWMDGRLDEIRISNAARSADWITTEYNNQFSTSTFYTIGDAVSP